MEQEGLVIDGFKVIVDKERCRTDKNFVPMYLGGGLGNARPDKRPKMMQLVEEDLQKEYSKWKK